MRRLNCLRVRLPSPALFLEVKQMARRLIVISKYPLCREDVEQVPDGVLKMNPHHHNTEMVITKTRFKQYIYTSCWNTMIKEKQPYNGKLYL